MKKTHFDLKPLGQLPERSSSSGNLLAKRLYRNNSLSKLAPLNTSISMLGSLNTSLIPSVSLRKLVRLDHSPPSVEISHGKIHLRRHDELPLLAQTGPLLKKKAAIRNKFEKLDSVTEKDILPEQLKADVSTLQVKEERKFKPSRKWLAKLKQGRQTLEEKLTPQDFIQLMEEEGGLGNEFCYLQKGQHPYDLRIVEFGGVTGDEYITISARGVTYFNWEGSRFVSLEEWRRQAFLFERLMKLQFFGKYRLHKNFTNWKKYSRKIGMKKTTDKLKAELLVHDRHLRTALLATRDLCCRMEKENYCCFDDAAPALPFTRFKAAQEAYLEQQFQKHLNEIQEEIKCEVANSLGVSMRDFKQENKISSGKQAKGLPLLIGDEKNLQMPYTKEATLRVQQQKFKRFLKLVQLLVVHSKVAMMNESTHATARKLAEQNDSYRQYLNARGKGGKESHFKGKQYIQCQLVVEEGQERSQLRPSKEQLTNLMEDIVNKSIVKLVRNHHRIINDPDINAILYEGAEEQPKEADSSNTLKAILGAEEKQEEMVALLTRSITTSYNYLQDFSTTLAPLVALYFRNQAQLTRIPALTSGDFFMIRQWIQRWRKQLQEMSKLNEQHESAVFVLNFKALKEMAIQCSNLCLSKMKEVVPKILQTALKKVQAELKESLRLMEVTPIGIEVFIVYQHNKISITARIEEFDDTLGQIGQLIQILKELGSSSETAVLRGSKERKQLGQTLKALRAKLEEAQMHSKVHQTYAQQEVRKMFPRVCQSLQNLYAKTKQPRVDADEMYVRVSEWEGELEHIEVELQKLKDYQKFLGMEDISEDSLRRFSSYFKLYGGIWAYRRRLDFYYNAILESEWRNVDLQGVKAALESFLQQSEALKKDIARSNHDEEYQIQYLDENVVNAVVYDIKKKIRPLVDAIQCLRDPSLEERQQRFIRSQLQKQEKAQLAQLVGEREGNVAQLMREGLIEELDFLKKIVFKSKKQVQLNSKMAAVGRFWGESASHSSKSLIDNFAQHYWVIAEEIDQKITVINCVREDPEIEEGEFKNRVQSEKNMFDSLRMLLGEWEKHHSFLAYFQPIFANAYWKGSSESKAYAYAESNWKKLTKQISKDFSLRKLASQEKKHLAILRQNNAIFQDLKFAVQMFLNAKRQAFPKLYFLSDEELLHLLLQDKDYASIDKHLTRIFPNLKSLELNEQRNCPIAVRNMVNQALTLRPSPAKQVLQLQEGLRVIEERMREGIRSGLLKCSNYYMQDDFNRSQWIRENILQVLLFIGNAQFTKLLEYDYLQADGEDPAQLLAYQLSQIKELHNMIKEEMHSSTHAESNYKLSVLLMQAGHFRDIIQKVIQENVTDDSSYEWLREIRSYYNGNDIAVTKYLTRSVEYGYEFVCANYSYTIGTLSERQMVEVVNSAGLGYLPVLHGSNQVIQALCNSNARSYFAVSLKPGLSTSFIQNICQGALSSNTSLELQGLAHLTEATAATISSFIFEARSIIQRRQAFHLGSISKNGLSLPSFSICFRINNDSELRPIQQHLKISFRIIKVPEISISTYIHCITDLAFFNIDTDLARRVEKTCEIINSCCGYRLIGLEQVRSFVLSSFSQDPQQFKEKMTKCLLHEINIKFVQQEQLKFFEGVVWEVMAGTKSEDAPRNKLKQEWDSKLLISHIIQTLKKRQACVLVGPAYSGKAHLMYQTYTACGVDPVEVFHTDLLPKDHFLGCFENGLWKQGILSRHLKKLAYSQEEWLIFEGEFGEVGEELVQAAVHGKLLQLNGQTLYLSPNWKFLFSTDVLHEDAVLPVGCELIAADRFSLFDQQLQHYLQTRVAKYFKSNIQGFGILKNMCINNFEKILKFRLKGRFLRPQHILTSFIAVLQSLLAKCPEKQLEQRENQSGIEKLFLWSIFWTLNTALNADQARKFQNQLYQQIKIDFDRSQPLGLSKFQFDSPQGSLRRVEQPVVQLNDTPFLVSEEMEATSKFIEMLLAKNKHVLLIGEQTCGKSQFLAYIRQNLGIENYSFLKIRFSKDMAFSSFEEMLRRKAKIVVNADTGKHLCAVNGKKLVLILDDINLLDQCSSIGTFLKSILSVGYYHDALTLQKIHLSNVAVLAAQNSSYQFRLSYDFTKCFKPVYLHPAPIRDIIELYHPMLNPQYAVQLCHNIASLHQFALMVQDNADIYFKRNISLPCKVLKILRSYQGKENIVKVWEYVSIKLYLNSNPLNESFRSKITAEIKNYSNLMLKNNQEDPSPIQNQQSFIRELSKRFTSATMDDNYEDYYVYLAMILQLSKPISIFTLNEPICASQKEEILLNLCTQFYSEYFRPFRGHQIASKTRPQGKVVIFISDNDEHFDELVDNMLNDSNDGFIYLVDFTSEASWKGTVDRHPSIAHFGCRYFKQPQNTCILELSPQQNKHLKYWLNLIQRAGKISNHTQQELCKVIQRISEKIQTKIDAIVLRQEKIYDISKSIKENGTSSKKQLEELRGQLEELVKGEEKKRRQLLQLKNSYQGELTEQMKAQRNQKIQAIQIELNEIMSQRRVNEDRTRLVSEDISKIDKITQSTANIVQRVEQQLKVIKAIRQEKHKIAVFFAMVEYFYTKNDKKYDSAIQNASKCLPLQFQEIMLSLFNCPVKINEKVGILWLFNEKSIVVEDESDELTQFIQKRYKNVHIIRQMKDLEDISQIQQGKAYIFVGEIRNQALYMSDVTTSASQRQKMKKEDPKDRQQRFIKEQKEQKPDYSKHIYFIFKQREKEERSNKQTTEIVSTLSVKSRQMKEQTSLPVRRVERKATRLNTLRNTLSLNTSSVGQSTTRQQSKFQSKEKDKVESINQLKQEATIKIKYRQSRDTQGYSKNDQQYQDYLVVNLQNEIFYRGGKRIVSVQSKFHKNVSNVTFICKKPTPKHTREFIHKYELISSQQNEALLEQMLEGVDPHQTTLISNLTQEYQKIVSKCQIQEKILLDKLLQNTQKSLSDIAKNSDFIQNVYENVKSVQEKLKDARRARAEPYSAYFKYCLICQDYQPLLKSISPLFRMGKARVKKLILNSIKYNEKIEREGELIEPQFKIDQNSSICEFKKALIKEVIINQSYLQSLYSICLFAILLQVKEDKTDKSYVQSFLDVMNRSAETSNIQKLLNQKQCSKELGQIFESYRNGSSDFVYNCHHYLIKRLELNLEKDYYQYKTEWQHLNESLIAIASSGADPFIEQLAQKTSLFLKQNSDHSKCLQAMIQKNFHKLVLVNFVKEQSYTKILYLVQQLQTEFNVILLFTSMHSYHKCSFLNKISEQRIVILEQNRFPHRQISAAVDKVAKAKGQHDKITKFILFNQINSYLKERIRFWNQGIIAQNASFYHTDLLLSLLAQAKIQGSKKMNILINQAIFVDREDLQKECKKWLKKQDEQAFGKTFHPNQTMSLEDNSLELNHFIGNDIADLKGQLSSVVECQGFAKSVVSSQERKQIKLDMFYSILTPHKMHLNRTINSISTQQQWSYLESITFESFKSLQTNCYKRQTDIFKSVLRQLNLRHYIQYKWLQHQIKALKATNKNLILTKQTQTIIRHLSQKKPCLGLNIDLQNLKDSLQKRINYFEELYTTNTPLKRLVLDYWSKSPHTITLYLYSITKKSDLLDDHIILRVISQKQEKERGWALGEVELTNCKYDLIKNCLEINDKNELRKIPKVALILGEKEPSTMQMLILPILYQGKQRFKLQIGSKLRDEGNIFKERVLGVLKSQE